MSRDLIKDKLKWIEEEKARLNALKQKEHLDEPVSRDLIKDKLKWIEEEKARLNAIKQKEHLDEPVSRSKRRRLV